MVGAEAYPCSATLYGPLQLVALGRAIAGKCCVAFIVCLASIGLCCILFSVCVVCVVLQEMEKMSDGEKKSAFAFWKQVNNFS